MLLPENTELMPSDILLWVNVWWFQALLFLSYRLFCAVCGRFFCAFNDSFSPAQRKSLMRAQPLSLSFLKNTFPRLSPHAFHFSPFQLISFLCVHLCCLNCWPKQSLCRWHCFLLKYFITSVSWVPLPVSYKCITSATQYLYIGSHAK